MQLVIKAEIESLVALICSVSDVVITFIWSHGIPNLVSLLVSPDVIHFHGKKQWDDQHCQIEELAVSTTIQWQIVFSIKVAGEDAATLSDHIVNG